MRFTVSLSPAGPFLASLLLAFSALFATDPARAAPGGTMVVRNDLGGLLGERQAEVARLEASGERVELRGRCDSACTMYLGLRNVCVSRGARFGFHGPSSYGHKLASAEFERWSEVMAQHYREPLRGWFLQVARYQIHGVIRISGAELIGFGYREC